MRKLQLLSAFGILLLIYLSGCSPDPLNASKPDQSPTVVLLSPSSTETSRPTATSTSEPTSTISPTPSPISTVTPTEVPQPVLIDKSNIDSLALIRQNPIYPNGVPESGIWSPDGSKIVLTTNLGLDILDGESLAVLHHFPEFRVQFFMEDGRLFTQTFNFEPQFIDLETYEVTPLPLDGLKNAEGKITPFAISPDGKLMAVAEKPNSIKVINLITQSSSEFEYFLQENVIFSTNYLKFAPDNNQLFLMISRPGGRPELLVFDVTKEMLTHEIIKIGIDIPEFSPDKKRLVFYPDDYVTLTVPETMTEWSSHTNVFRSTISLEENAWYSGVAYSFQVDSTKLGILYNATVTNRSKKQNHYISTLLIYNTGSGKVEKFINDLPPTAFDFQFHPDGSKFFTISKDGYVMLWNSEDGSFVTQSKAYETSLYEKGISQDASKIAFPIPGGARILSSETGQILNELVNYPEGYPYSFIASFVNNHTIAISFQSYSWTQTDSIDLNTGEMIRRYPELNRCTFNRAGNTMICDLGDLKLFDVATGRTLLQFRSVNQGKYYTVSDNGLYTAYCTPGSETVFLWDTQKGTQIRYLRNNTLSVCATMDFSDDSSLLVTAAGTSWTIPEGTLLPTMEVNTPGLVTISPDKEFVLIYPNVFELQNGKLIAILPSVDDRISDIFFSADSKEIVMVGENKIFHFAVLK